MSERGIILTQPYRVIREGGEGSGKDGTTFIPSVDAEGNLSWSNSDGKENPTTVNIKGAKGDKGDKGDTGERGSDGQNYVLTEADKQAIANLVPVEGSIPTKEELSELIEEYFREHPVDGVTTEVVAQAIENYFTANQIEDKDTTYTFGFDANENALTITPKDGTPQFIFFPVYDDSAIRQSLDGKANGAGITFSIVDGGLVATYEA